ncbi:MAG: CRISPR-associated endoribonuclease Cas6 [Candidatus Methanosuratincola sp.]
MQFVSDKPLTVPITYNHLIQGLLYNSITHALADILHNMGFAYERRRFKLFTFSRILGNYEIDKEKGSIIFTSPFRIVVSSLSKEFIEQITEELLRRESIIINSQRTHLDSAELSEHPIKQRSIRIRMLSPVTIYSTLSAKDGRRKTYYYAPFEREFSRLTSENAAKKYKAFYKKNSVGELSIVPLDVDKGNEKIVTYKNTVIKGWTGIYELSGDPGLMKVVYDAGLGGKNSQGFGCFEIIG